MYSFRQVFFIQGDNQVLKRYTNFLMIDKSTKFHDDFW